MLFFSLSVIFMYDLYEFFSSIPSPPIQRSRFSAVSAAAQVPRRTIVLFFFIAARSESLSAKLFSYDSSSQSSNRLDSAPFSKQLSNGAYAAASLPPSAVSISFSASIAAASFELLPTCAFILSRTASTVASE